MMATGCSCDGCSGIPEAGCSHRGDDRPLTGLSDYWISRFLTTYDAQCQECGETGPHFNGGRVLECSECGTRFPAPDEVR